MKKLLFFAAVCAALVSCKKEDIPDKPDIAYVNVSFVMNKISADIIKYYSVMYVYTDFDGEEHSEEITGSCTKSFQTLKPELSSTLSHPFTVSLVFVPKPDVPEKSSGLYTPTINYKFVIKAVDTNGDSVLGSGYFHSHECTQTNQTRKHFDDFVQASSITAETIGLRLSLNNINEWQFGWDYMK